jgi:hypothetical protein
LNASYICLHAFSLHRESPDPDPVRRTPHFWGGSVTLKQGGTQFGQWEGEGLTDVVSSWRSGSAAREERRQAGLDVVGAVGMVREELIGSVMLRVGSRGSGDSRRGVEQNSSECGAEAVVARCGGSKAGIALTHAHIYRRLRQWTLMARRWKPRSKNGGGGAVQTSGAVWAPLFGQWGWCLLVLQKFPNFAWGYIGYSAHLSQLCKCQIPNINHIKNPRIDSIFEFSMNLKGVQTFWENLINSRKFSLDLIFTKVNLVGHICM